jgi:hypothetical protein
MMLLNKEEKGAMQKQRRYDGVVMGPDGNPLTIDDLPPPGTTRWVIRRKAEVVAAVRGGLLTMEDACQRYGLSEEEFDGWRKSIEKHGLPGLRTTRIQHYRAAGV